MKAIVVLGSPRTSMNTEVLLDHVIIGLERMKVDVEKIRLKELEITPCIACDACTRTGKCYKEDSMTSIYKKFNNSDIIIIASPLYFNSVSSLTKIMIDRCQAFWSSKYILNQPSIDKSKKRRGMFICTAGSLQGENGFVGATLVMDLFFKAVNTEYVYNLLVDNTDKSFVGEREEILNTAMKMGIELSVF